MTMPPIIDALIATGLVGGSFILGALLLIASWLRRIRWKE